MKPFATISDVEILFRPLRDNEEARALELLVVVSDMLRLEGEKKGVNLDEKLILSPPFKSVIKSVVVDIVGRALMTSTDSEPMVQFSESALGYSKSGTFLTPGGGLFIKEAELKRLGLRKQKYGVIEWYGKDKGYIDNSI